MKLSKIKSNPNNPRLIKDDRFEKLCQSIKEFPKMLELRPIVIDENNMVLGGNMRLKALLHLGFKEVPDNYFKNADDLTEDEMRRFIIADNIGFGEWSSLDDWDTVELESWGLEMEGFADIDFEKDYSDKNKEIDTDDFDDKMILKLQFNEADYHIVKDKLLHLASTPEQAIFKLLGITQSE